MKLTRQEFGITATLVVAIISMLAVGCTKSEPAQRDVKKTQTITFYDNVMGCDIYAVDTGLAGRYDSEPSDLIDGKQIPSRYFWLSKCPEGNSGTHWGQRQGKKNITVGNVVVNEDYKVPSRAPRLPDEKRAYTEKEILEFNERIRIQEMDRAASLERQRQQALYELERLRENALAKLSPEERKALNLP